MIQVREELKLLLDHVDEVVSAAVWQDKLMIVTKRGAVFCVARDFHSGQLYTEQMV